MLNKAQMAIVKKDVRAVTSNRRMLGVLITVPLVVSVVMPLSFALTVLYGSPDDARSLETPLAGLIDETGYASPDDFRLAVLAALINNVMPALFLMVPIMASSVMAGGAFVGEKEKNTLETLLYSPLPLREIFGAKITAAFLVGFAVALVSFAVMSATFLIVTLVAIGEPVPPGVNWIVVIPVVSPAVSLIAINVIVRGSAKAQSSEESQQRAVFLVLPPVLIFIGQFWGILQFGFLAFLAAGLALGAVALVLFKGSFGRFRREALLR